MPFMAATASRDEIERFRLESGDVLITKDSETWDDIGVPSLVAKSADDLLSGYHLALLRPFEEILGSYLAQALHSKAVAYQFHVRANGVTRYGLTHTGIQSVQLPLPQPSPSCRPPSSATWTTRTGASGGTSPPSGSSSRCWRRSGRPGVVNQAVTRGLDPNAPPQALRRRVARRRARALGGAAAEDCCKTCASATWTSTHGKTRYPFVTLALLRLRCLGQE